MQRARHSAAPFDRRLIRDFVAAFLVFFGGALAIGGGAGLAVPHSLQAHSASTPRSGLAHRIPRSLPAAPIYDQPVAWPAFEPPPTLAVFLVLAAMFAAFVTFNLAVARHLRCVSASPRRRSWRGG